MEYLPYTFTIFYHRFLPDVGKYELIDHPLKLFKVGRNIIATFFSI